jgi:hypothetical protein
VEDVADTADASGRLVLTADILAVTILTGWTILLKNDSMVEDFDVLFRNSSLLIAAMRLSKICLGTAFVLLLVFASIDCIAVSLLLPMLESLFDCISGVDCGGEEFDECVRN